MVAVAALFLRQKGSKDGQHLDGAASRGSFAEARGAGASASTPDYMLVSVAAVTEDGTLVAASATGSQPGAMPRARGE